MSDDYSSFQYDILAALDDTGPAHGLGVKATLETDYGYDDINHGRYYPNVDDLVERGFVEKGKRDERTNEYRLTVAGRNELARRVRELGGRWE